MSVDITTLDLQSVIGRGGMATVWRAEHRPSKVPLAVKVMHPDLLINADARASFLTEATVLGRLNHPNILRVLGRGIVNTATARRCGEQLVAGTPYLIMDYFPEGTLHQSPLPADWLTLRSTLLSILDALATAHASDLVHRDLKPSNILMGPKGPVLSDFGIVHDWSTVDPTTEAKLSGTPSYMPPEQILHRWRFYGPWTDLYALGCLAYWLCSGQAPFGHQATATVLDCHLNAKPPPLKPRFDIPAEFQDWALGCLEKSLSKRPQLAADAARDLLTMDSLKVVTAYGHHLADVVVDDRTLFVPPTFNTVSLAHLLDSPAETAQVVIPHDWHLPADLHPAEPWVDTSFQQPHSRRSPPFVGRLTERDKIWAALTEAASGNLQCVYVRGETGIGKSTLMQWVSRRAQVLGVALPLTINHHLGFSEVNGIGGMLRREWRAIGLSGRELADHVRARIQGTSAMGDEITLLLCLETAQTSVGDAAQQRTRFAAVARWIEMLCETRPRILLVEDFQWDDETGAFLRFLKTTRPQLPLLVLIALRPFNGVESTLLLPGEEQRNADLADDVIQLSSLSPKECHILLGAQMRISTESQDLLHVLSRGNPLRLQTLLRGWLRKGVLQWTDETFTLSVEAGFDEPKSQIQIWEDVLCVAGEAYPEIFEILEVGACLGNGVVGSEWRQATRILGLGFTVELMDTLIESGIIALTQSDRFEFSHGQCREAFLARCQAAGRTRDVHGAIVTVIDEIAMVSPERRAQHLMGAGLFDRAMEAYADAWRAIRSQERFTVGRRILISWAYCLKQRGYGRDGIEWQALKMRWADLCLQTGLSERAYRHAASVLATTHDKRPLPLIIEALLLQTQARKWAAHESQRNLQRMVTARLLAEETGDLRLITRCLERHAVYLHTYGQLHQARDVFRDAMSRCASVEDRELEALLNLGLARLLMETGEWIAAESHCDTALTLHLCGQSDEVFSDVSLELLIMENRSSQLASVLLTKGDLARRVESPETAEKYYQMAINILERIGAHELWAARVNLALAHCDRGAWTLAMQNLLVASQFAAQLELHAIKHMISTCTLLALARLNDWIAFDTQLTTLLSQEEHHYAQLDSVETLARLITYLRDEGTTDRVMRVERLYVFQQEALGL